MKFAASIIAALAGSTMAAPVLVGTHLNNPADFEISIGSADNQLSKRKDLSANKLALYSVLGGGVLGFALGPVGMRIINDIWGVQTPATTSNKNDKKRSVHIDPKDVTIEEARELFIDRYVDAILEENPHDGNDAAFCTAVEYTISNPAATLFDVQFALTAADGQQTSFDCFLVTGPVTITIPANATESEFAFAAPESATFLNGVLNVLA